MSLKDVLNKKSPAITQGNSPRTGTSSGGIQPSPISKPLRFSSPAITNASPMKFQWQGDGPVITNAPTSHMFGPSPAITGASGSRSIPAAPIPSGLGKLTQTIGCIRDGIAKQGTKSSTPAGVGPAIADTQKAGCSGRIVRISIIHASDV